MAKQTRDIDDRLHEFDAKVVAERGVGAKENCDSLVNNIRSFVARTNDGSFDELNLVAELMDTARCDVYYEDRLKLVRSRLLERMGSSMCERVLEASFPSPSLYSWAWFWRRDLSTTDLRSIQLAASHYKDLINIQVKSCLRPPERVRAELEDYGNAILASAALTFGPLARRGYRVLHANTTKRIEQASKPLK